MKLVKLFIPLTTTLLLFSNCKNADIKSLRTAYEDDFYIGTALDTNQIEEKNPKVTNLISKEFSSITPENIMKSMFTHPEKDSYDFEMSKKYVAFGKKHNMFIHGHTLIWHSQLPNWMRQIKDSATMKEVMTDHISRIVSEFKGQINSWDVVNEALNEDGTLRKSVFLNTYGKDFITLAFKTAAQADPKTDLYYNDYNLCNSKKRRGAVELIQNLQKKGIKIDGVGEQGHWNLKTPTLEQIEQTILDFSALGVKVAFSELDISVLPSPWELVGADVNQKFENSPEMNPYPQTLPEAVQKQLADRYEAIFKLFLKHKDKISRVTFWGVNDGQSWLNDWPIKGRTNYPLVFDRDFKPKEAYKKIMQLKSKK